MIRVFFFFPESPKCIESLGFRPASKYLFKKREAMSWEVKADVGICEDICRPQNKVNPDHG